ncbi:MAG: hypothetical protein J6P03_01060 [Opitutales bacterium]|nr:hypothetical protein [Opitutales bacterium]
MGGRFSNAFRRADSGIAPFPKGAFVLCGEVSRAEFARGYLVWAFILALAGAGAYRILTHFCGFEGGYDSRRALFALFLTPAFTLLFSGEIKRLRSLGLPAALALLNFYPFYWGAALLAAALALLPQNKRTHNVK